MLIKRFERPLTQDERARLEELSHYYEPQVMLRRHRDDQLRLHIGSGAVLAIYLSATFVMTASGIALIYGMIACLVLLSPWIGYLVGCYRDGRSFEQTERASGRRQELQAIQERNALTCWHISALACLCLDTADKNVGVYWFFQVEEKRFLLLHSFRFGGAPPAQFEINETIEGSRVYPLSLESESIGDDLPQHRLPDIQALLPLEDGDLFALSLAELLDNPMALLKTRTGNLWERA